MSKGASWLLLIAMGTAGVGCNAGVGRALLAATVISVTAARAAAAMCAAEEVDCSSGSAAEPVYTGGYQEPYSAAVDW